MKYLKHENEYLKKIAFNWRTTELHCKFMVIKESKTELSIAKECRVLEINISGYYEWLNKKPYKIDENAKTEIIKTYHKHKGTYGRARITQSLRNDEIVINHKKVYHIMCKLGLKAIIRKKWSIKKYVKENVAYNLLNREFKTADFSPMPVRESRLSF